MRVASITRDTWWYSVTTRIVHTHCDNYTVGGRMTRNNIDFMCDVLFYDLYLEAKAKTLNIVNDVDIYISVCYI